MLSTQFKSSASAALRRHQPRAVLLGLATLALALLPVEAQAACRGGFCVSGFDQGGRHTVIFTTSISNVTQFNAATPQGQIELGANQRQFTFRNAPAGRIETYALQACHKNVFSSSCTPWATFTHTPR